MDGTGGGELPALMIAAIAGLFGAGLGALIGRIFDRMRATGGRLLTVLFAVAGGVGAQFVDMSPATVDVESGLTGVPEAPSTSVSDMSFETFRAYLIDNPEVGPIYRQLEALSPVGAENYMRWMLGTARTLWAEGYRGPDLLQEMTRRSAAHVDGEVRRLPDAALNAVLEARVGLVSQLGAVDPRICPGTMPIFAGDMPEGAMDVSTGAAPQIIALVFETPRSDTHPNLPVDEYVEITQAIVRDLAGRHGAAVDVFLGEAVLTRETAADYCRVERDYLLHVLAIPPGPEGQREAFYRTLLGYVPGN